jgi:holo-[acyl-carrier protein] synthase
MTPSAVTVGIDLVQISRIEAALRDFPQRFLRRLYTAPEIDYCNAAGAGVTAAAHLAARFAAKEAALKVLQPHERGIGWRAIEVFRAAGGVPELRLHGAARELADAAGYTDFALSLSHEGDYATAVVIATRSAIGCSAVARLQPAVAGLPVPSRSQGEFVAMSERIRAILREHGRLSQGVETLTDDQDLYRAGMTSQASVSVMLALEGAFDIEFPDHMLTRSVFSSIAAMRRAVEELSARESDTQSAAPL